MSWTLQQVAKHNTSSSCWVIIKNKVYDVTDFLAQHPGGAKIILTYAGRDATAAYEPIHPPDTLIKHLHPKMHMGGLDTDSVETIRRQSESRRKTKDELRMERAEKHKPSLSRILSLRDMEDVARKVLSYRALAYYASAADDETTLDENIRAFSRIFFHPRVLRAVSQCDPSTSILAFKSRLPIFVSGAALAKLGHPLGEANITRGAGKLDIIQMVSSNASLSVSQIAAARVSPSQPLFFQLYKHADRRKAEELVREVEDLGYKAIFLTVDAIVAGNRERDIRAPFILDDEEKKVPEIDGMEEGKRTGEMPSRPEDTSDAEEEVIEGGNAALMLRNNDIDMTWGETIPWLRSVTKLPIVIKGIQCVADAVLAAEAGVDGVMISNHGGRQLEYSQPSINVLHRLRQERPDVFNKVEVYMDGGVRRGTDVLKALCLGAKAVGLGRPFLYAQSAYGEAGVIKVIKILEREIITGMQLLGARNVHQLVPEMVEQVTWQPVEKARL